MSKGLTELVAAEVRAEMGRKQVTGVALARKLGVSHAYVSRRLNGETPFDVGDLERIAGILEVSPRRLLGDAA
jgi:transcriptional regulator with XRE-family HTH domain